MEPAIKRWARIPKHLKEKHEMLHRFSYKFKKGKKGKRRVLEASLCVTKYYEDRPHAEPVAWMPPLDIEGHYQVTTDGQYTELIGGEVLKAGFGVNIRTKAKIVATTYGSSKKEPDSEVHEYLAAKTGIGFAAELRDVLNIKHLEVASDCEAMVERMKRMMLPGSAAEKICLSNLSQQDG